MDKPWQAETLQRQGWWVQRFDNENDARAWIRGKLKAHKKSTNPVTKVRLLYLDDGSIPIGPPVAPEKSFDESWAP
jgi:hypothetical protein